MKKGLDPKRWDEFLLLLLLDRVEREKFLKKIAKGRLLKDE